MYPIFKICYSTIERGVDMPVSEAQQKAVNKYLRNNFDDIKIRVPKGKREEYKEAAKAAGYDSFNGFAIEAIEEKLLKCNKQTHER